MEKDKPVRKKSTDKYEQLPAPPPDPLLTIVNDVPDAFKRLYGYQEREALFLKTLRETIEMEGQKSNRSSMNKRQHSISTGATSSSSTTSASGCQCDNEQHFTEKTHNNSDSDILLDECESYVSPLLKRSGPSITAALSTQGAIDQLDKLHVILGQLLIMQEQNYQIRRNTRDVDTLIGLKKLQRQISKDPDSFLNTNFDLSDAEQEMEMEYNESLLETILAAGKSASNKRNSSKRQRLRSKSVINEDRSIQNHDKDSKSAYTMRRQSALNDAKAKVSKWTKVKAAFKWERANVSSMNEGKSTDSGIGLSPINNEVARYLRVPSVPCTGSSADSVLSSSSGHLLSGGSIPPSPGTMSSASSIEDVGAMSEEFRNNRDSSKSESRCDSRTQDDDARRSRSLDGDATLSSSFTRHLDKQNKNKTPWRKVKDIIQTHRGSLKGKSRSRSVKSTSSVGCSRDASPCDSTDAYSNIDSAKTKVLFIQTTADRTTESCSSSQTSPIRKTNPSLLLTAPIFDGSSCSTSPISPGPLIGSSVSSHDESVELRYTKHSNSLSRSRRSKISLDISSVPEGVPVDSSPSPGKGKPPPSPLTLAARQDSSDTEQNDQPKASPVMPHRNTKWSTKISKKTQSGPSSPSQHFEFFESEDLSSGDFSEPCTPHTQLTPKNSLLAYQQDEINRKYHELQQQISLEFQAKQKEWERIRMSTIAANCPVPASLQKDDQVNKDPKGAVSKPIEENLSADFKKKLQEWRIKKQQSTTTAPFKETQSSPTKETDHKKIDWHLWKTGQIKLEGQGLKPLPDEKDLPEDFQKKLDEWKRMKASGSGSSYNSPQADPSIKRQSLKLTNLTRNDCGSKKAKHSDDLDKHERERQRIERERLKCQEREKIEKLSKLKAMVAEHPAKEVVVQTSKGVLKFEGISRKFTRKLYEWEKARGIGPESSTFALLHPGYRPLVVGNGEGEMESNEKGSPLARSLSMDSMSPNPSVLSISHQPSSLSLNNVDDLKDNSSLNERLVSSNPELELDDDIAQDEPEAVIVEVEDDYIDTASSLFTASPMLEQQTPVYRYEQTRKEYCAGKKEAVFLDDKTTNERNTVNKAWKDVTKLGTVNKDKYGYNENVLHVQTVLKSLIETFPLLKTNLDCDSSVVEVDIVKDLAEEIIKMLGKLDDTVMEKEELDKRMSIIDNQLSVLRQTLNFLFQNADKKSNRNDDLPEISITPDDHEKRIAVISVTPVFQGEVVINQVQVMGDVHSTSITPDDSQQENIPEQDSKNDSTNDTTTNTTTTSSSSTMHNRKLRSQTSLEADSTVKKSNKSTNGINGSNGTTTKQKRKLRRLGSRQSSKTESDSDDNTPNIILDAPRRVKRKTSKTKLRIDPIASHADSDLATQSISTPSAPSHISQSEDIVYVLKIKPGQVIEQTEFTASEPRHQQEDTILMPPRETHVELLDGSLENVSSTSNVFVKTKRKLFTPVDNKAGAVFGRDLESSGSSDKNDHEKSSVNHAAANKLEDEQKIITNLPPLPQSPNGPRRLDQKGPPPKEPSPIIRHMIAKYNQRLSAERKTGSPQSSGSCSPVAWRSPVLERRVRQQTEKYLYQVTKSSSAGTVDKQIRTNSIPNTDEDEVTVCKAMKSSSAGTLMDNWSSKSLPQNHTDFEADFDATCRLPLACDSLHRIHKKGTATDKSNTDLESCGKEKIYRKHVVDANISTVASTGGAIRKISAKPPPLCLDQMDESLMRRASDNTPDRSSNTMPKIKRKYDRKPPSPSSAKPLLDLNIRHPALSHSASTPITDRALKIRKAKEEFLRPANLRACYCEGEEVWMKNRTSQISGGSESSIDECIITKSASAGMIAASALENARLGGFESLPRSSMRNSESPGISGGRFGFGTLASKLKLVKLRKSGSKDLTKMNTVSRLCRQSLMVEILPKDVENNVSPTTSSNVRNNILPAANGMAADRCASSRHDRGSKEMEQTTVHNEQIRKSATSNMGLGLILFRRADRAERLKKSKSIGQLQDDEIRD